MDHDFNSAILDAVAHRPWPMPQRPWFMTQTWRDLLFAHWPVDSDRVRRLVPSTFELDDYGGTAWLGIVAFRMTNVAPRAVPNILGISEFPELNVRTFVRVGDRPGVFFFSLDAGSAVAVQVARIGLNLPYLHATMSLVVDGETIAFRSHRQDASAEFEATYRPEGPTFHAPAGSLEYFLTERYCLYHQHRGGAPYRIDIHHPQWSLQRAVARVERNTMAAAHDIVLPASDPVLLFSRRQDVVAWPPARLDEV